MKIQFCGAAMGVTGSCHLITTEKHKILLDCGQFQGSKTREAMNYEPFPFDPAEIDYMILSHAHIDHCGRIPLLVKRGFKGEIYCTDATADLVEVMLKDSGYIHEKEAEWKNRKNERAGRPAVEPLYTFNDAMDSLKFIKPVLYDQLIELNDEMKFVFNDAGHILGSAITELWIKEEDKTSKIVFSGDLGVMDRPILRNPTIIKKADYVIMETTYGNRVHPSNSLDVTRLMDIIRDTAKRGGTTVIPSFAVGRTQELIYELNRVYDSDSEYRKDFENLMVYVDSPMATTATEVFKRNAQVFDDETKAYITKGDNPLDFKNLKFYENQSGIHVAQQRSDAEGDHFGQRHVRCRQDPPSSETQSLESEIQHHFCRISGGRNAGKTFTGRRERGDALWGKRAGKCTDTQSGRILGTCR